MQYIELIGWLGNILIITQFMQKDMMKLRIYGTLGGSIWFIYACILGTVSLAVLNFLIIVIQLYHIRKLLKESKVEI